MSSGRKPPAPPPHTSSGKGVVCNAGMFQMLWDLLSILALAGNSWDDPKPKIIRVKGVNHRKPAPVSVGCKKA